MKEIISHYSESCTLDAKWPQTTTVLLLLAIIDTHTRLTAPFPGLPGWAGTRKIKPIWILLKQETVSGSGISWPICKSAPCSRQITTPAPHHSVFYRPDALPAAQPTASKHWRPTIIDTAHILWGRVYGTVQYSYFLSGCLPNPMTAACS